jgi:amino acid transporter
MVKFLVQLCLVLLLLTAFAALAVMGNTKSALALWVALASFGGVALLYWFDRECVRKARARRDAQESARLSDLARRSGQNDTVEVSGSTPLALALIFIVVGAFVIYLFIPFPNVLALSGGILALALGGLLLLGALPALGKPIPSLRCPRRVSKRLSRHWWRGTWWTAFICSKSQRATVPTPCWCFESSPCNSSCPGSGRSID